MLFLQWGKAEGGAGVGSFRCDGNQGSHFELVSIEILATCTYSLPSIFLEFNPWLVESMDLEPMDTEGKVYVISRR